ncbi:DUF397 domain-containing protein [Streptomyces sp. NPDC003753]|uniref:DUF397 domain-containing protein n=1 Tax=unclassified Streptomyces TaxID=2593676 RepID=UPI00190733B4|nr:DUF397 domain-containing protein [Streptomyces sp. Y2F8-2]GHK04281.1 hypothetical protein SY2F82_60780 [Streptomyces sp. Y2F8-2]
MSSALRWFKSSYSNDSGGDCVEVAQDVDVIHIRDSKNPTGPTLRVSSGAWGAFLKGARTP